MAQQRSVDDILAELLGGNLPVEDQATPHVPSTGLGAPSAPSSSAPQDSSGTAPDDAPTHQRSCHGGAQWREPGANGTSRLPVPEEPGRPAFGEGGAEAEVPSPQCPYSQLDAQTSACASVEPTAATSGGASAPPPQALAPALAQAPAGSGAPPEAQAAPPLGGLTADPVPIPPHPGASEAVSVSQWAATEKEAAAHSSAARHQHISREHIPTTPTPPVLAASGSPVVLPEEWTPSSAAAAGVASPADRATPLLGLNTHPSCRGDNGTSSTEDGLVATAWEGAAAHSPALPRSTPADAAADVPLQVDDGRPDDDAELQARGEFIEQQQQPVAAAALPHEQALLEAEAAEHRLLTMGAAGGTRREPLADVAAALSGAQQDWHALGRPDASGAMIGGRALAKCEGLPVCLPAGVGDQLQQRWRQLGQPIAIAVSGPLVALGTAAGVTVVAKLQPAAAAAAAPAAASSDTPSGGDAAPGGGAPGMVLQLGEPASQVEAITALGFSVTSAPGDPLWLVAGHANGTVVVWDIQRRPAKQVATIVQHALPVVHASFLPGRGTSQALTMDSRGRLVLHAFTNLLLRVTTASRVLIDGQYGPLLSATHLVPFASQLAPPQTAVPSSGSSRAVSDSGLPAGISSAPSPVHTPPSGGGLLQQLAEESSRRSMPDAGAAAAVTTGGAAAAAPDVLRVGNGVAAICGPDDCYIARIKPSGDLLLLYRIPRPSQGPSPQHAAMPYAAWLPHHRAPPGEAPPARVTDAVSIPVAHLALGWGADVALLEIPLIGDHVASEAQAQAADLQPLGTMAAAAGVGSNSSSSSSSAAPYQIQPLGFGAGAATMSAAANMAAAAAAAAARHTAPFLRNASQRLQPAGVAAAMALTQQAVTDLSAAHPLSLVSMWSAAALAQLPGSDDDGGAAAAAAASPGGPDTGQHVLCVHWPDPHLVCVVVSQGYHVQLVVATMSGEVREQLAVPDALLPSGAVRLGTPWFGCSAAGSGGRLLLLGETGCHVVRLMSWQERLRTLQDIGKLKLALWFAVQMYAQLLKQQQQAPGAAVASGTVRADAAAAQQLQQWMVNLTIGYVSAVLDRLCTASGATASPSSCAAVSRAAAALAVNMCVLLKAPQVLFDHVFPVFRDRSAQQQQQQQQQTAAGGAGDASPDKNGGCGEATTCLGALMDELERHILADEFDRLAPEVMQAYVEHCAAGGQLQRVEAAVLHIDVTSMDLDQVLKLCEAHGLHSALAYVYNRLGDYSRPALELLRCVASAPTAQARAACGYKLLVYLRCIFRNQAWPPGTGPLPAGQHDALKAQLLGLLLYCNVADLAREWQLPPGQLHAPPLRLRDPYPCLQILLRLDASALIAVVWEAVDGWDVMESDMLAAAGKKPPLTTTAAVLGPGGAEPGLLVASQGVVNALVHLMASLQDEGGGGEGAQQLSASGAAAVMDFVTSLVAAGRVAVEPSFALHLLSHVAGATQRWLATQQQQQPTSQQVAGFRAQQEDLFVCLLQAVGVDAPGAVPVPSRLDAAAASQALQLARGAGFWRAAALVLHLQERYTELLQLHLRHPGGGGSSSSSSSSSDAGTASPAASVFDHINAFLEESAGGNGGSAHQGGLQKLRSAVQELLPELLQRDAEATARLIVRHFGHDVQAIVVERLAGKDDQQFRFLRAAVAEHAKLQRSGGSRSGGGDSGGRDSAGGGGSVGGSLAAKSSMAAVDPLASPVMCDLYVFLLCRHRPRAVLQFLQAEGPYDVRAAIGHCQQHGVWDAQAFLHERMGDPDAACRLYVQELQRCISALEKALRATVDADPVALVGSLLGGGSSSGSRVAGEGSAPASPAVAASPGADVAAAAVTRSASGAQAAAAASNLALAGGSPLVQAQQLLRQRFGSFASAGQAQGTAGYYSPDGGEPQGEAESAYAALAYSWLSQLSSRLRAIMPKAPTAHGGDGASVPPLVQQQQQQPPPPPQPKPPPQLLATWQALQASIAFCQRNTTVASSGAAAKALRAAGGKDAATAAPPHASHWYQLMDVFVECLGRVRNAPPATAAAAPGTAAGSRAVLRLVHTALMQEVITCTAEFLPLHHIMRHIIRAYGHRPFGEFRSTLLALFSACHYEHNIVSTAKHLIQGAAFSDAWRKYQRHGGAVQQPLAASAPLAAAAAAEADVPAAGGNAPPDDNSADTALPVVPPDSHFVKAAKRNPTGARIRLDVRHLLGVSANAADTGFAFSDVSAALMAASDSAPLAPSGRRDRRPLGTAQAASAPYGTTMLSAAPVGQSHASADDFDVDELLSWSMSKLQAAVGPAGT